MRPTLLPNLRRLWRDARTLQLGSDPASAVVLHLARPDVVRTLDLLDGSSTTLGLLDEAGALGLAEGEVRSMIDALRRAGLVLGAHELTPSGLPESIRRRLTGEAAAIALRQRSTRPALIAPNEHAAQPGGGPDQGGPTPAEVLRRRAIARVLVSGDGPLVAPVAAALAAAGVGHIDLALEGLAQTGEVLVGGLSTDDVQQPRAIGTAAAVGRTAPGTRFARVRPDTAAFVVHFGGREPTALAARGLRLRNLPRLEVGIRLGTVTVGPLVRPNASPCRECLDLHRRDRDPAWPVLKAQLATAPDGEEEPCAHTTALAGAAYAAEEVLAYLDGTEVRTEAAIVEIARAGEVKRRKWAAHPRCDCSRRRRLPKRGSE